MKTTEIPTQTFPNGTVWATDLEPFAQFVNGTVTAAAFYGDRWVVYYKTAKRNLTKRVAASEVEAA